MMSMIKSVSITVGGDTVPMWYCKACNNYKSDEKPTSGTVCNAKLKEFSYDLFRKYWEEEHDEKLTDEDIQDLVPEWYYTIVDHYDCNTFSVCESQEFVQEKHEGQVVDTIESKFLRLWGELSVPSADDLQR